MIRALALACVLAAAAGARAQGLEAECSASFPERLADARQALALYGAELERFEAARPAVEFFEAHCRWLSPLERAARKLDEPNAFVCDDGARPAGLSAELVLRFSVVPTVGHYQAAHGDNHRCVELDARARVSLVLDPEPTPARQLEVLCYGDTGPRCTAARAATAKAVDRH